MALNSHLGASSLAPTRRNLTYLISQFFLNVYRRLRFQNHLRTAQDNHLPSHLKLNEGWWLLHAVGIKINTTLLVLKR